MPVAVHGPATDRTAFIDLWTEIEMDVGSTTASEDVFASFMRHAQAAEQDPMLHPVVQNMYGQVDDLIAAYLAGSTLDNMAENAGF